jgi:rhodanese-related sulfurtransferase
MAAKTKKGKKTNKRLLTAWEPPEGAGMPVGCVATTFTFSPVFFEEECLSRFLQMQSDAHEDGPVYIIEREEKLADVRCVSVLVDACHCKGSRNLRWDLLTAHVPKAILHSKISLLCWTNRIRVIAASANLTDDGYRRNKEIYGIIDFYKGSHAPLQFLRDIILFLRGAATAYVNTGTEGTSPAIDRCTGFLDEVKAISKGWGDSNEVRGKKDNRVHAILTGPGRPDAMEQVMALWPEGPAPINAYVTSPFFDPAGIDNQPAKTLWGKLRQRGEASVTFNLVAEQDSDENIIVLHAPKELLDAEPERESANTYLSILSEQNDEDAVPRPLHLKSIWFEGNEWDAYLIGSGNFTSRGLGLVKTPNLEANILYLDNRKGNPGASKALEQSYPEGAIIDERLEKKWEHLSDEGEDEAGQASIPLPTAFGAAVYISNGNKKYVQLEFLNHPPDGWQVIWTSDAEKKIFDEQLWKERQAPNKILLEWTNEMAPSGFDVTWLDCKGRAWWPVNVDRAGSLPPLEELKDLPLDLLINVLTSARPLHQVLRRWINKKDKEKDAIKGNEVVDPHKRVDTSAFLLQKTYRMTAALNGLRKRLERPAMSVDAIEWRLKGPVGVLAVQNAILHEARSSNEKVFLLTELALELSRAKPRFAPGCLSIEVVNQHIRDMMVELKVQTMETLGTCPQSLKDYVRIAFKEMVL